MLADGKVLAKKLVPVSDSRHVRDLLHASPQESKACLGRRRHAQRENEQLRTTDKKFSAAYRQCTNPTCLAKAKEEES